MKRSTNTAPVSLSTSYLIGSPRIGISMITLQSLGTSLPAGTRSRLIVYTLGAARRPSEREQFALGAARRAHGKETLGRKRDYTGARTWFRHARGSATLAHSDIRFVA